jgi:Mismatch repair ATPase (MutS family)
MRQDNTTLELDKVLELVSSYAMSPMGQTMILESKPSFERPQVLAQMADTEAAWLATQRLGALPRDGITDVRPLAKRLLAQGTLSGLDFRALAMHYNAVKQAISYHNRYVQLQDLPKHLSQYFSQLRYQESIHSMLLHAVDDEGLFLDAASIELANIRKQCALCNPTSNNKFKKHFLRIVNTSPTRSLPNAMTAL